MDTGWKQLKYVWLQVDDTGVASCTHSPFTFSLVYPFHVCIRRIDNCSGTVLHVAQSGCIEAEDVIRPFSCLPYAWDEPSLGKPGSQRLAISLVGLRRVGEFDLERVGSCTQVGSVLRT